MKQKLQSKIEGTSDAYFTHRSVEKWICRDFPTKWSNPHRIWTTTTYRPKNKKVRRLSYSGGDFDFFTLFFFSRKAAIGTVSVVRRHPHFFLDRGEPFINFEFRPFISFLFFTFFKEKESNERPLMTAVAPREAADFYGGARMRFFNRGSSMRIDERILSF